MCTMGQEILKVQHEMMYSPAIIITMITTMTSTMTSTMTTTSTMASGGSVVVDGVMDGLGTGEAACRGQGQFQHENNYNHIQ